MVRSHPDTVAGLRFICAELSACVPYSSGHEVQNMLCSQSHYKHIVLPILQTAVKFYIIIDVSSPAVGIFVAEKWLDSVVSVERHSKQVMPVKLVLGDSLVNVFSVPGIYSTFWKAR